MPDRIFVDTNILVYAHDVSAGKKHVTAKKLIQELWASNTGCFPYCLRDVPSVRTKGETSGSVWRKADLTSYADS